MNDELADELRAMAAADQAATPLANSPDVAEQATWRRLTADHGDRLRDIMAELAWPTADLVGPDAAHAEWLIAQHADRQLDVQREALHLMSAADGVSPREVAFLRDRALVTAGRAQIYGTQIAGVVNGRPVAWPCIEPERMDARRAGVGIEPFALYTARFAPEETS